MADFKSAMLKFKLNQGELVVDNKILRRKPVDKILKTCDVEQINKILSE